MTDEKKNTESTQNSSDLIDIVTGKVGKITALIVAVVALVGALQSGLQTIFKSPEKDEEQAGKPPKLKDCFKPELTHPPEVSLNGWDSMDLHLKGRNDCKETLGVYVTFKTRSDRVRIESAFSDCLDPHKASCWEERSIGKEEIDWKISPPRLRPLGAFDEPVQIAVNWIIFTSESKKQLHANKAEFKLLADESTL